MEYRIGETFQWGDDLVKTVVDTNEDFGCEQCYFYRNPGCGHMNCMGESRGDGTNVYFEKVDEMNRVMENKVKMEIECNVEYIKQVCEAGGYAYSEEDIVNICKTPVRLSVDDIDRTPNEYRIVLAFLAYYMYLKNNNK